MLKLIIFIIGTAVVARTSQMEGRISNGRVATANEFRNHVGFAFQHRGWCSGSLISHTWVLTAAHCCGDATAVTVHLGSRLRGKGGPKQFVEGIENLIKHDKFDKGTLDYDICLIRIPYTNYTASIQPAQLPQLSDKEARYEGSDVIVCGWGRSSQNNPVLAELSHCIDAQVSRTGVCAAKYYADEAMTMCVESTDKRSVCKGDSGAPLLLKHSGTQIGVTSFTSHLGCDVNEPMAFTRVGACLEWIAAHTDVVLES